LEQLDETGGGLPALAIEHDPAAITKSWGSKSLSGLGWLSKLSPWSSAPAQPEPVQQNAQASWNVPIDDSALGDVPMPEHKDVPARAGKRKASVTFLEPGDLLSGEPMIAHKRPKTEVDEYKYDENKKPPYAYTYLIYHAVKDSCKVKITLGEIYIQIMQDYAYYRARSKVTAWKNSIRHNLTMHKSFIKVAREHGDSGKGGYWRVDEHIAKEEIDFNPKAVADEGSKKKKKKKKKKKEELPLTLLSAGSPVSPPVGQLGVVGSINSMSPSIAVQQYSPPPQSSSASSFPYPESEQSGSLYGSGSGAGFDDVFDIDDIEKEISNQGGGAAATGGPTGMPTIVSDDLDEPALLRKLAAQLGSDQPQSKLGASSIGLPADLMGVSSAFQASVSGIFTGLSASYNGVHDKFTESFGGLSEGFTSIFQWGS